MFHPERIGVWGERIEFPVSRERAVEYAEATNDPLPVHLSGRYASPVFAVVPPFTIMAEATMAVVPDELIVKILHGEHDIHLHRPIVPGERLSCRAAVVGIHQRSSGVVVTTLIHTRDAAGNPVNDQYFRGFFRGGSLPAELAGGVGETGPEHGFDESLRAREPDAVVTQKYDADQTFRYSEAAGDPMPVHLDEDFAKLMGLPGIIIHGLCTMAFTSHAVIGQLCPDDPARLRRLAVRFSAPAQPRHAITTSLWRAGAGRYAFETVTDEGATVIKDGLAELAT